MVNVDVYCKVGQRWKKHSTVAADRSLYDPPTEIALDLAGGQIANGRIGCRLVIDRQHVYQAELFAGCTSVRKVDWYPR